MYKSGGACNLQAGEVAHAESKPLPASLYATTRHLGQAKHLLMTCYMLPATLQACAIQQLLPAPFLFCIETASTYQWWLCPVLRRPPAARPFPAPGTGLPRLLQRHPHTAAGYVGSAARGMWYRQSQMGSQDLQHMGCQVGLRPPYCQLQGALWIL
jgi:hypothetical protein